MRWCDVDWAAALIKLPAEIMKTDQDHEVPITPAVHALLIRIRDRFPMIDPEGLVVPGARPKRPMSDATMGAVIERMNDAAARRGEHGPNGLPYWHDPKLKRAVVPHGFRSCFSTYLKEKARADWFVSEACLAHEVADKVAAAYTRTRFLELRRFAHLAWEHYLTTGTVKKAEEIEAEHERAFQFLTMPALAAE